MPKVVTVDPWDGKDGVPFEEEPFEWMTMMMSKVMVMVMVTSFRYYYIRRQGDEMNRERACILHMMGSLV
jgi:hypothetical protein